MCSLFAVVVSVLWTAPGYASFWLTQSNTVNKQDRQAILRLAGEYKVSFRFEDTVSLREDYAPSKPYLSQALEVVKVIHNSERKIELQHILVIPPAHRGHPPHIMKHWRQVWTYEDPTIYEYKGHNTWERRRLSRNEVAGTWSQAVFQVDDSPRYESFGRWKHNGNHSFWESEETWRPLPRREANRAKKYQVLVSRNKQTLTPRGWIHEQDSYKLDLKTPTEPVVALERGKNIYQKHTFNSSPVDAHWEKTKLFWGDVHKVWRDILDKKSRIKLKESFDGRPMWMYVFALAKKAETFDYKQGDFIEDIEMVINAYIVE